MILRNLRFLTFSILLITTAATTFVHAEPIGWIERFALADDRDAALSELVPGTDDHFFYHCLHFQTTGQLEQAETVLAQWMAKYQGASTPAINAMVDRQRLLTYDLSPQRTIDHLIKRLNIKLDHAPPVTRNERRYPSEFDPANLDAKRLIQEALNQNDELKPAAMTFLADRFLNDEAVGYGISLAALLDRIKTPSIDRLEELVAKEMANRRPNEKRFGNLAAHKLLTLEELRSLSAKVPEVADDEAMVTAILTRLRPVGMPTCRSRPTRRFNI